MINVDGKVYRNIQEQVKKNQDDIEKLENKVFDETTVVNELQEQVKDIQEDLDDLDTKKILGLNLKQNIISRGFDIMKEYGDDSFELGVLGSLQLPYYIAGQEGVRTKEGLQIELNVGDEVYLTDYTNLQLDVYYKLDHFESWRRGQSNLAGNEGWLHYGKFIAPAHCFIIICIKHYPSETIFTSIDEAINALVINRTIITNAGEQLDSLKTGNYLIGDLEIRNHLTYGYWNYNYDIMTISLQRVVFDKILCFDNDVILYWSDDVVLALHIFDSETYSNSNLVIDTGYFVKGMCRAFIPKGTYFLIIAKKADNSNFAIGDIDTKFWFRKLDNSKRVFETKDRHIVSINHRGYNSIAPECTLPAYRLAKQKGFAAVEADISFTSDDIPVLLHDETINRTARNIDGTTISSDVYIDKITYAQALEYDFGICKSSVYAGTKIPTFEQFVALCKNIGLSAYVEIKSSTRTPLTKEKIENLISIVNSYGMKESVTWISFDYLSLYTISTIDPEARLGWITMVGDTNAQIKQCYQNLCLKTGFNEVFADVFQPRMSIDAVNKAKELGMGYELYFDSQNNETEDNIKNAPSYVKNFTTNILIAEDIVYEANIGDKNGNLVV